MFMITIFYNHNEHSMREKTSFSRGLLHFNKSTKTFSCEASDLECAGVHVSFSSSIMVTIEENNHSKVFYYNSKKKDNEDEIQYWSYKSNDDYKFIIFND